MASSRKNWSYWTHSFFVAATSVAIGLALLSYNPNDPSFSTFDRRWTAPHNQLGYLGSWSADLLFQGLGYSSWIIPLFGIALIFIKKKNYSSLLTWKSLFSLLGMLVASCVLVRLLCGASNGSNFLREGFAGFGVYSLLRPILGKAGLFLLASLIIWGAIVLHFETWVTHAIELVEKKFGEVISWRPKFKAQPKTKEPEIDPIVVAPAVEDDVEPIIHLDFSVEKKSPEKKASEKKSVQPSEWKMPALNMLTPAKIQRNKLSKSELMDTAKKITTTFKSFEVEGEITEITPGPILTIYEFQPAPGTRIQKINSVSTDLAMALGVPSIRIVAPIPGKSVAGIEVPNPEREDIVLREMLEMTARLDSLKIPLCLGKDTEGKGVIEDLSKMPHLLIGGATSMGKSVLVNSILTGLLYRFSPSDLRILIVDPKLVEFKIYEDIPHLLLPIVNDPADASKALKWAVTETKRRYKVMQEVAAKNLEAYNAKALGESGGGLERFPYIVVIIDELAELMLTSKKDVEQSIVRLTQLARAAGIHLIMATQRPSADVVTGLIKSNCPSRAALRVAGSSDSRIILDTVGAELLLGKGDMLFTSSGPMGLRRLQGSFVSDADVEKICEHWRKQGAPEYRNEILAEPEDLSAEGGERDQLFNDVVTYAKEKGAISTSLIQRRFQIGYTRAARIMEQLEAAGIVGEQASAGKPRDVLI